ncbi:hypothetical protein [Bosea sp. NPDC055594]
MIDRLTMAQRGALTKWLRGPMSIYHAGGVRRDVGKRLLEMGLIEPVEQGFHPSYSICRLTEAGHAALQKDTHDDR